MAIEVVGAVQNQEQVRVVVAENNQTGLTEQELKQKLARYMELMNQIEELKKEAEAIKTELKEAGVGVGEPVKVVLDDGRIVKVVEKVQVRETLDKKKAKELLPEQLYNQIAKVKKVKLYEIRQVKR